MLFIRDSYAFKRLGTRSKVFLSFYSFSLFQRQLMSRNISQNYKYPFQIILEKVFQEHCPFCSRNMASVPQGAFAAKKVRRNEEKLKEYKFNMDLNPTKYSSKFMNSIWGQYNRYSVHNLKKIMDSSAVSMSISKDKDLGTNAQAAEKNTISAEVGSMGSAISFTPNKMFN